MPGTTPTARSRPPRVDAIASRRALRTETQRKRTQRRRRRVTLAVVALLLAPALYSYVTTMMMPSSLPLGVRTVDWIRTHHGAWLVDEVENLYYTWTAPSKGGPALKTLPTVGTSVAAKPAAPKIFHPPRIEPLIHPMLPGEGVWRSTGRLVDGAPPVLVTTFRPNPDYPRVVAYVAWFDHTRTQLALYPGRYEPPTAVVRGPMQVPQNQRWKLLAVFNSGFMHRDSNGGFFVDGMSNEPLVDGQGTVVAYKNGRVNLITWHGGPAPSRRSGIVLARQNLPLIVTNGKPNPLLSNDSLWGSTLGNAVLVWRTAVGIDRHGNLLYAAADYQTAASLAGIMIRAGAVRAIELDINPEWPTLVTYGRGGVENASRIVPNYQQPVNRYLVPDDRDFFAVYRRTTPAALRYVPFS